MKTIPKEDETPKTEKKREKQQQKREKGQHYWPDLSHEAIQYIE